MEKRAINAATVQAPVVGIKRNFAQMKSKSMADNLVQSPVPKEVVEIEEREKQETEDFIQPLPRA